MFAICFQAMLRVNKKKDKVLVAFDKQISEHMCSFVRPRHELL